MSKNETNGQESGESVDEQRARRERFSMTVLDGDGGGYVNVRNDSHGDDAGAHTYSVAVESGEATDCSCPHAVHRGAHCKHQVAVENRPLVVSSASAAGASPAPAIATDGGERGEDTDGDGARDVSPCPGCGSLTVDDTCGRDRCEGADEIDEAPL